MKYITTILFILLFPAVAYSSEPTQIEDAEPQEESVVILRENEGYGGKIDVSEMSQREILRERIREANEADPENYIPESIVDEYSDEEIEEFFQGEPIEDEEEWEEEDDEETEENNEEMETITTEEQTAEQQEEEENHGKEAAAAGVLMTAAAGYGIKKSYEQDDEEEEEDDGYEDDDEDYEEDEDYSSNGIAEAGAMYGGGGGEIDTGIEIPPADEPWSYNNISTRYIDTGDQINDAATYMSKLASEAFGKDVPPWFWKVVLRCEVGNDVKNAHFNNPGGMDYSSWMDGFCTGPVSAQTFVDNGNETHEGAKFFSIQDGMMCQVAWFCRPGADSWWAEEVSAAAKAKTFAEAEQVIRMHVAHYNRGMELADYDAEYGDDHFYSEDVPYYWVLKDEYMQV